MKFLLTIAIACGLAFAPGSQTQFVLDDYYTVVHNPLIKQPAFYPKIFSSHLFDAYPSSGYIQFPYYRPVLESSYILDYHLFKLQPTGYQWVNWLIHLINGWLVFILIFWLFENSWLALLTALLFVVLPSHEWVVRYITGRGDSLQTFFGLLSLIALVWSLKTKKILGYGGAFVAFLLSLLTREFGYLLPFYGILVGYTYAQGRHVLRFSCWWMLIGALSLLITYHLLAKLGPILSWHLWYFTFVGLCLGVSFLLLRLPSGRGIGIFLVLTLALMSLSQKSYWIEEEVLLRHTHALEQTPYTACHQQLLMKYDSDPAAVQELIKLEHHPIVKSLWFGRLGKMAFDRQQLGPALAYFDRSLKYNPLNVDALNAKAIVLLESGKPKEGLALLYEALKRDSSYGPTLRNLGVYYQSHNDFLKARIFFTQARYYEGY
ncbi:MAG: hypothetical protein HY209_04310 [Candidatus Omnitrophica bacterium]|nr:hypothetical protein [Candidatus Omnitrophota bacterium]